MKRIDKKRNGNTKNETIYIENNTGQWYNTTT